MAFGWVVPERLLGKDVMRVKNRRAVALRYRSQHDAAPRVTAKGSGAVAEAIVRRAEESGVAVQQDAGLTEALMHLEIDSVIPEALYRVVAEVLAYVYSARQRAE